MHRHLDTDNQFDSGLVVLKVAANTNTTQNTDIDTASKQSYQELVRYPGAELLWNYVIQWFSAPTHYR